MSVVKLILQEVQQQQQLRFRVGAKMATQLRTCVEISSIEPLN